MDLQVIGIYMTILRLSREELWVWHYVWPDMTIDSVPGSGKLTGPKNNIITTVFEDIDSQEFGLKKDKTILTQFYWCR